MVDMKILVGLARVGCAASVAGFFVYLAMRSVSISGAKGEMQLYIIDIYLKFAVAAFISSVAMCATVVARGVSRNTRAHVLIGDALLGLVALFFSVGLWILWRL